MNKNRIDLKLVREELGIPEPAETKPSLFALTQSFLFGAVFVAFIAVNFFGVRF